MFIGSSVYCICIAFLCSFLILELMTPVNAVDCTNHHTVQGGDSCWGIAQKFGLNNAEFMRVNNIGNDCSALQVPKQNENNQKWKKCSDI